jgi:acyl-CoA dehydrogenase
MQALSLIILIAFVTAILLYHRASLKHWTIITPIVLIFFTLLYPTHMTTIILAGLMYVLIALVLNIKSLRRTLLTASIFKMYRSVLPSMSSTEKEAINAGTITWEADIFAGDPDWDKLLSMQRAVLTAEEQAFIDGPLNALCAMINDWDITHNRLDLPPELWQFIKDKGFFAFIIPKEFGGLAFSPYAISCILITLYGCSTSVASTIGVPNSLGPAELLLKYGTQTQKNYYLPRLAKGIEVPCFALTGVEAGSDAGSIGDIGIVCRGTFNGQEMLGINLNFDKRYITLAPVATLVGLAFKLRDPEHLLGQIDDYGITCALIPRDTVGVEIGRRHFPVNQAFMNGPIRGTNVFIPLDYIIGGQDMAGHGWRMLMECLAAGRAVTLPSSGVGAGVLASHATGAYARIRRQFNMPIGFFEGIEEVLGRIGGYTYLMKSALHLTLDYLNAEQKSAVAAAIVKYHVTELGRKVSNDAMDVHGGKGIQLGPKNYLASGYESIPVAITVEGANILTRSMIIFGQGAIRCHPYVFKEMEAAQTNDLAKFDDVFWGHIGYTLRNLTRTFWLGFSNARFLGAPRKTAERRYYKIFARYSAALALFVDVAMFTLGGSLKRKEKISARLGDILSYLYMGSGVLKQFAADGAPAEDEALMHFACRSVIYSTQEAFHNLIRNFPGRILPTVLRYIIFPFGRLYSYPADEYTKKIATLLLAPSAARDRLTQNVYMPDTTENNLGLLKIALQKVVACEPIFAKVHMAFKMGEIKGDSLLQRFTAARDCALITEPEFQELVEMQELSLAVIAVDDFAADEL